MFELWNPFISSPRSQATKPTTTEDKECCKRLCSHTQAQTAHLDVLDFSSPSLRNNNPRQCRIFFKREIVNFGGETRRKGGSFIYSGIIVELTLHDSTKSKFVTWNFSSSSSSLNYLPSIQSPGIRLPPPSAPRERRDNRRTQWHRPPAPLPGWWMLDIIISNSEQRSKFVYTINTKVLLNYKYKILLFGRARQWTCFFNASKIRIVLAELHAVHRVLAAWCALVTILKKRVKHRSMANNCKHRGMRLVFFLT